MKAMLNHCLFGGSNEFEMKTTDVWQNKASTKKINFLVSLFIGQAASLNFSPKAQPCLGSESNSLQNDSSVPSEFVVNHLESNVKKVQNVYNNEISSMDRSETVEETDVSDIHQTPSNNDVSHEARLEEKSEKYCLKQGNIKRKKGFFRNIFSRFFPVFKKLKK